MANSGKVPSCAVTPMGIHWFGPEPDNYIIYAPDGSIVSGRFATLTDGGSMFAYSAFTSFPDDLDFPAMTTQGVTNSLFGTVGMFFYCTSLTSLPEGMTLSVLTDGTNMFNYCTSLTSLPDGMTLSALTTGAGMFYNCIGLTSLPEGMSLSSLTNGYNMFRGCTSLTTEACTAILNALPTYTSGSRTITLPNTDAAKAADASIATAKKWTVAYA